MTAIDSNITLPPQAKAPQMSGAGRKEDVHTEKAGPSQKDFTAALTQTPPKKEALPTKTEKAPQTTETQQPQAPQNADRDHDVKGKAIAVLLDKLAQGTEIDPALLEKAQTGDTEALKEILLSLGIKTETTGLENIAATDPQGQIIAVLAQLLQQQQQAVTQGPSPSETAPVSAQVSAPAPIAQSPAVQTAPAGSGQLSQGTALLLAQEEQLQQQTLQTAQQKGAELAVKEQPRPAPAQQINTQQQTPQQQAQQQTVPQQTANNALQTGTSGLGDGSGFTGDSPDGGFPQQGAGTQTGTDGQFLTGQDSRGGQQTALPQFAAAKAAGSFQSPAVHKVFLTMQRNAADRIQQMTLQLEPAAMGRVAVTMIFGKDGAMKAHLLVEKPETFQMLNRDSHALEKALKEAGIDLGDNALSFDLASGQEQFEKAEAERNSEKGFHFYMQGEDSEIHAAEDLAGMMSAAQANDYVLKKGSVNILI